MNDPQVPQISTEQAAALAASGEVLLLDVREPQEWLAGRAEWALHMPLGELNPEAVPDDRPVVAVCGSGNRSRKAALVLTGAGRKVSNMTGGMKAWDEAGLPVVTDDGTPGIV